MKDGKEERVEAFSAIKRIAIPLYLNIKNQVNAWFFLYINFKWVSVFILK